MSYINFTTSPDNPDIKLSLGWPVHDGVMLGKHKRVKGISIDGERVEFQNPALAGNLHRTLLQRRAYVRANQFDCISFAGLILDYPGMHPRAIPFALETFGNTIHANDRSITDPVNLFGRNIHGRTSWRHVMAPAHTLQEPMYIHKLGTDGPICLSGLAGALKMYDCTTAHRAPLQ